MLLNRQTEDKALELKCGVKPNRLYPRQGLHQSSAAEFKVWCKTLVLRKDKGTHCWEVKVTIAVLKNLQTIIAQLWLRYLRQI